MVTNTNFIDVGSVTEFVRRPRRIQVSGRNVAVFEQDGRFFAIDANCYHSSGPLEEHVGDIEDINGEACIRCPMHKYIISLETGHSFYEAVDVIPQPTGQPLIKSLGFKSKGLKQRCHQVAVREGRVLVQLDTGGEVESDKYAYR